MASAFSPAPPCTSRIASFAATPPLRRTATAFSYTVGHGQLYITNSFITDNGADGVHIQPTGAGAAKVIIDNSTIENNNLAGVKADGTSNTGGSNTTIVDSSVSGNTNAGISI